MDLLTDICFNHRFYFVTIQENYFSFCYKDLFNLKLSPLCHQLFCFLFLFRSYIIVFRTFRDQ